MVRSDVGFSPYEPNDGDLDKLRHSHFPDMAIKGSRVGWAESGVSARSVLSFTGNTLYDKERVPEHTPPQLSQPRNSGTPTNGFKPWEEWAMTVEATTPEEWDAVLEAIKDDPRPRKVALVREARARGFELQLRETLRFFELTPSDETAIDIPEGDGE